VTIIPTKTVVFEKIEALFPIRGSNRRVCGGSSRGKVVRGMERVRDLMNHRMGMCPYTGRGGLFM